MVMCMCTGGGGFEGGSINEPPTQLAPTQLLVQMGKLYQVDLRTKDTTDKKCTGMVGDTLDRFISI